MHFLIYRLKKNYENTLEKEKNKYRDKLENGKIKADKHLDSLTKVKDPY